MNKKRYNVKEVAEALGITRQTLYYWFKKGWVKPNRDYRNYPVFTDEDIKKIEKWRNTLRRP